MMFIFMLLFGFTQESKAGEISVVDVRRNITLSEDDPVYKDFYINAGPGSGLKKNLVITAVRKINVRDASGANAVGEILVPVGQLKVIAIFDKVAVAREYTLLSRDELPMLEQTGIMSGDRIDLQGSFIDNSKPKPKRKVAEEDQATNTTAMVAITTAVPAAPAPTAPPGANPVVSANAVAEKLISAAPTAPPNGGTNVVTAIKSNTGNNPVSPTAAKVETLEKTADSGNNTLHE
ncbi:hypothetical protein [Bdellovibrio sp.]|uniref:hypothetical protein n=1 Tax=Bdellovibrio sp. TaxID=28201 RepID=UPI0039E3E72B